MSHSKFISNNIKLEPLFVLFAFFAAAIRIFFWVYTNRTWEDALITLTPAMNFWDGMGLTHHPSEPRVQSFTSPISVIVPIIGIPFMSGISFTKLISIVASVFTIYFANKIANRLNFSFFSKILFFSYLAFDQLQVFFGMAGMETQIAVLVMLSSAYFFLMDDFSNLGILSGIALITRPEFFLPVFLFSVYLFFYKRKYFLKYMLCAMIFSLPWYLFAELYFGSIIPNTIKAKTFGGAVGPFKGSFTDLFNYFINSWYCIAPFKEFWFVKSFPLPLWSLKLFMSLVYLLFTLGVSHSVLKRDLKLFVLFSAVSGFFAYRVVCQVNTYYMWYIPPFSAVFFIFVCIGLDFLSKQKYSKLFSFTLAIVLTIGYVIHIPFSFNVAKTVQSSIENAVRKETGIRLNKLMGENDTVVLEPLGYIGYEIRGKTTWDIPGLSSPKVVNTIKNKHTTSLDSLIEELRPDYAVLRPNELADFVKIRPNAARSYVKVDEVKASNVNLRFMGYEEFNGDNDFIILKKTEIDLPSQKSL